jgi:hypothetical protein
MNVLITQTHASKYGVTIEGICGKVTGVVSVMRSDKSMQVLCVNAAHRAWRGGGRYLASLDDALAAYKSPEMKSIIRAAADAEKQDSEMKEAA